MDIVSQHHALAGSASLTQESSHSAVSWQAIFAGAFVAASASLILAGLGSGFGLASVSPWANSGVSATTFTWMTAVWLVIVQWFASGLGGYLAGRMRTKWTGLHTHEVFFRDTAHGFITWSVATIIVAAFLVSAASSIIGGGAHAAATVASGASQGAAVAATQNTAGSDMSASALAPYAMDTLFRPDHPVASGDTSGNASAADARDARAETARILANGVATGDVPTADRTYLAQLVAARTGISQDEAQKRVDTAIAESKAAADKARTAADAARKAASEASIYTALAMLVGAFIACIAAALGGQRRDLHA
jgi:hypothetical protein